MTKDFYDAVYRESHVSGCDGGPAGMQDHTRMLWNRAVE